MKIGVISAMVQEMDLLIEDMKISSRETIGMREYYSGTLYGHEAVLVFSRWGKVASASTVTTLIEKYEVDIVVFTGVAGAADPDLKVGDIVVADKLVQHDMDISAMAGAGKFEIPLLCKTYFDVDAVHVEQAMKSADDYLRNVMPAELSRGMLDEFDIISPKVIVGTIASGDQFIADVEKVHSLVRQVENLKCVEMEGSAVAQVCFEHGVPFIVLRVVSDNADETANIDFDRFVNGAARYFTRGIIKKLISEL